MIDLFWNLKQNFEINVDIPFYSSKKVKWEASRIVVRDSSAVRRLFVLLVEAVGRQSALHKENSAFSAETLHRHISTFRGYRILFSIIHNHLTLRKWCYTPLQHDFALDPMISSFHFHFDFFSNNCHVTLRKLRLPKCIIGDDCI